MIYTNLNPIGRKIFSQLSILALEQLARMFIGFTVSLFVIRHLGPANYGQLIFAQSIAIIMSVFTNLGLETLLLKEFRLKKYSTREIFGTAIFLKFIFASFAFVALIFTMILLAEINYLIFLICVSQVLLCLNVFESYFFSCSDAKSIAIPKAMSFLMVSIFKVILILRDAELIWFAAASIFEVTLLIAFYLYRSKRASIGFLPFVVSFQLIRELLLKSWPIAISFLVTTALLKLDQFTIKYYLGNEYLGVYGASIRFIEIFYFLPALMTTVFLPILIEMYGAETSVSQYSTAERDLGRAVFSLGIIIGSILYFVSDYIAQYLLGPSFIESGELIKIFSTAIPFIFYHSYRKKIFVVEGNYMIILIYPIVTSLILLMSIFFLMPSYGLKGVALAFSLSWIASPTVIPVLVGRKRDLVGFLFMFRFSKLEHRGR